MTAAYLHTPDLFLIRHGETDWNLAGRFQGRSDVPMNDTGFEQARLAGERLSQMVRLCVAERIDIVSSPLLRARQTAGEIYRAIDRGEDEIKVSEALGEISLGEWEGMTTHEVKSAFPALRRARKQDQWNFAPPGGESYADRTPEIGEFLAAIDRPSVLVCHAGVIKICLYLLGATDRQSAPVSRISHGNIYAWSKRRLAAH